MFDGRRRGWNGFVGEGSSTESLALAVNSLPGQRTGLGML